MPENRERELVLAPNEYCYVLDTTKGHINCYVGPNKTSLAQTDQPVRFDERSKRFESSELTGAVKLFVTAPANWYVILKNPAPDNGHPSAGISNTSVGLEVGRKITVHGPASFALWPGQMARVIAGHRLKSNQYLLLQIYDPEQAQKTWRQVLGSPTDDGEEPSFVTGQKLLIRGTETSYYLPPSGVEVLPDPQGRHVRDAVTLQRLEYCVLVDEDGTKTFVRGEAVVFPRPSQSFLCRGGRRKYRAIELSETTGLYIKVTSPYADPDGTTHAEGEELFLTGRDVLYFPRAEHAIIRYGDSEIHQAIAIPRGEGRYVLERQTGEVRLVTGPAMFLPDPRRDVLTRRILSDREVTAFYPGNAEAMAFNRALRARWEPREPSEVSADRKQRGRRREPDADDAGDAGFQGDAFARSTAFRRPRTLTLDNRYDGAVTIDVWSGHAVQVVDRSGNRRVVTGPTRILLGYDETLETLELSTGVPKSDRAPLATAYLRLAGNKVTDQIVLQSSDLVSVQLTLSYRVHFDGEPERFFQVADYIRLLCDHATSRLRASLGRIPIHELRSDGTELARDALLGPRSDGARAGLRFEENGMCVYDLEVLGLEVVDPEVAELLDEAQLQSVRSSIELAQQEARLSHRRRSEQIARDILDEEERTALAKIEHELRTQQEGHRAVLQRLLLESEAERKRQEAALAQATAEAEVRSQQLATRRREHEEDVRQKEAVQALVLASIDAQTKGTIARAKAFSPQLVGALNRLGDEQLLAALSENFGELAAVEGRGILETARKFLDFVPSAMVPTLGAGPAAEAK